jgi:adenylate cyclase
MLTVFWQDDEGNHEAQVVKPYSVIGRGSTTDVQIANTSVSRRHAAIVETPEGWVLRDLDSQNGTAVGDHPVREHTIRDGDVAKLGEVALRFVRSVHDSIHLGDSAHGAGDAASWQHHPGSLTLSAGDVVMGKVLARSEGQAPGADDIALALSRLTAAAKVLLSATSLSTLFERVLDAVVENTPVEHAFLLLHDESGNQLVPKAGRCLDGRQGDFPISQGIARHVFRRSESILTLDAIEDPRFKSMSIMTQGIRSVMCAPLLNQGRTLGVLFTGSTSGRVPLKDHHLHLLTVIANLAAVAIDQAQLRTRIENELLLRSRLTRYHSPALVDELLSRSGEHGTLAPTEREVSVLFADIVGFSTRTEQMPPAAVSRLLNGIFSELVEIVFAHGGTLDKFLGDGLMAIFGAPNDLPGHAEQAVRCALAMQKRIAELEIHDGPPDPVQLRIGINSGPVVAGDLGSERRVDYTVLGNTVNVAARLEALVAQPGETVVGPATAAALGKELRTESLGPQPLKGIQEAVEVFRVAP